MFEIVTRGEARAKGDKHFFTGVPCKHGHVVQRFVSDGTCAECRRIRSKEWYSDKEYGALKQRKWRSLPENREAERLRRKALWQKNPEKHRSYHREYGAANRDKKRKLCRDWYARNVEYERERCSVKQRNRRSADGSHTKEDVLDILKLQRSRCAICRTKLGKKYHVDHIVPLAAGGSNDRRNLQITCGPCNQSKSARDPIAFMQMRGMLL